MLLIKLSVKYTNREGPIFYLITHNAIKRLKLVRYVNLYMKKVGLRRNNSSSSARTYTYVVTSCLKK